VFYFVEMENKQMTESTNPTAQVAEQPAQGAGASDAQTQQQPAAGEVFDKDRAMATINALREIEKQAKKNEKELARLKEAEQKRADAELSEIDRLKKHAEEIEAHNAKLQGDILRRDVIAETGIPAVFADRLKGTTKDEMLADAQEIMKALPQKSAPNLPPTNPSSGQGAETEAQKRERLFGARNNLFDIKSIEAGGGGVVWHNKP